MCVRRVLLPIGCCLLASAPLFAGVDPLAVSPGDASRVVLVGDACPAFSWGEVKAATGYEIVVYRVVEDGEEAEPVLRQSFDGAVSGWTPPLDRCLERGSRYAWSVRSVGRKGHSEWSRPALFEVAPGLSRGEIEQILLVLRERPSTPAYEDSGGSESRRSQAVSSAEASSRVTLSTLAASLDGHLAVSGHLEVGGSEGGRVPYGCRWRVVKTTAASVVVDCHDIGTDYYALSGGCYGPNTESNRTSCFPLDPHQLPLVRFGNGAATANYAETVRARGWWGRWEADALAGSHEVAVLCCKW